VRQVAPEELVSLAGIGTDHAATLLIVAGDNPQRLRSEASFASLCGVSPVEASSGKVVRHRLNRGGNREANRALYMICLARMRRDCRTKEYVALGAPRRARASERSSALPQAVNMLWVVADDAPDGPDPASSRAESALVATRRSIPGVVP
jgi:transposase